VARNCQAFFRCAEIGQTDAEDFRLTPSGSIRFTPLRSAVAADLTLALSLRRLPVRQLAGGAAAGSPPTAASLSQK